MARLDVTRLNPVYVNEGGSSAVADVNLEAPGSARWAAVHNLHGTDLNVLAPSNEIYKYTVEGAAARSTYQSPLNSGKLKEDTALADFDGTVTAVDAGTTAVFSAKTNVEADTTITRGGIDITAQIGKPTFNGIDWDGSALTDILVNGEGTGLEEGDVISFPVTDNTDVTITFTVGQDDLQLGAGLNLLKATTMAVALVVPANTIVQVPTFSKIQIQATDGGNDATAVLYYT